MKIMKNIMHTNPFLKNKGQLFSSKAPYYVAVLFILTMLLLLFGFLLLRIGSANISTPKNFETFIFLQRFINSPLCFSASQEGFNSFFNTIDIQRFEQETLDRCYSVEPLKFKNKKRAFRLTLRNIIDGSERSITTKNWGDSAIITKVPKKITIYDKGKFSEGLFIMEFQNA